MSGPADLVLRGGEVHALDGSDRTAEAVAVRDGRVVRVGSDYEVGFLVGVETRVLDLDGRVVIPGFVDAHTHLPMVGRYERRADLRGVESVEGVLDRLRTAGAPPDATAADWRLGFSLDPDLPVDRAALDAFDGPTAAVTEDLHGAAVNAAALDALDVDADDGRLVEADVDRLFAATEPDREATRALVATAQRVAVRRGVTGVHDVVTRTRAPAVYRSMDRDGDLAVRVRLQYAASHLDAVTGAGLATNHGSERVETGAVKVFVDGSIASHTARLRDPYDDVDTRGEWVTPPADLRAVVDRAAGEGLQVAAHAIGDAAVEATLDAFEAAPGERHRVEHAELATDDHLARMAERGVVASMQPNFHRWAGDGGLYERRLGSARRDRTNRLTAARDAGVRLAFGSDCMPLSPLVGVHHAVTAPTDAQRLDVTAALRAYTGGGAYAGFAEDRRGTVAPGRDADLVALDGSPWTASDVRDVDVALTVVGGAVVYDGRNA
ncbi:MAG: amidohydrolase [Halobacteriaceae archaeon]